MYVREGQACWAEPVGVESDRTNWTNSGRACGGRE